MTGAIPLKIFAPAQVTDKTSALVAQVSSDNFYIFDGKCKIFHS
jgi:hypothetical protein